MQLENYSNPYNFLTPLQLNIQFNTQLRSLKLSQAKNGIFAGNSRKESDYTQFDETLTCNFLLKNYLFTFSPILQNLENQLSHHIKTPQIY